MSRLIGDRRAVSVTVGFVLMLVVAGLLLATVLTAASGLLESQSKQVVDDELAVVGSQLASNLHEADRLAQVAHQDATTTGVNGTVSLAVGLPETVAGTGYRIEIGNETITLRTSNPAVETTVSYPATAVPVDTDGELSGGDLQVTYNASAPGTLVSDGRLEVDQ